MADLDAVLEQLKQERKRAEGELKQLEKVITTLSRMRTTSSNGSGSGGMKRQLSAAARERIAAAQRARWAKVRAQSKKMS
jgi:glutamate 5-kinase